MRGTPWSDDENDLIVADYFQMLIEDIAGRPYSKTEHRNALAGLIPRSPKSIEYKYRNISAVLIGANETSIPGYKPAFNYQGGLCDAVRRWFDARETPFASSDYRPQNGFAAPPSIFMTPPPTLRNAPDPDELPKTMAAARFFHAAERDERNRALGEAGKALVYTRERSTLAQQGRPDLAKKVVWTSKVSGDGAGYDIESFEEDGSLRLIEVKTTNGWERSPFHISANEATVAEERRDEWVLFRVFNFARAPGAFELRPPLDAHVALTPTSFRATFQ